MFNFRESKVPLFSERETVDDALKYAGEVAGPAGTTAAMVMYNTLLETLAKQEDANKEAGEVEGDENA